MDVPLNGQYDGGSFFFFFDWNNTHPLSLEECSLQNASTVSLQRRDPGTAQDGAVQGLFEIVELNGHDWLDCEGEGEGERGETICSVKLMHPLSFG